jgi:hypothetical protein
MHLSSNEDDGSGSESEIRRDAECRKLNGIESTAGCS